jgi:outer membrane lipoprotein LolB
VRAALRAALAGLALAGLAGCASVAPPAGGATVPAAPPGTVFAGRLAVAIEAIGEAPPRAFFGAFELAGDAERGTLGLATPLGTAVAEARWTPGEVLLVTPRETRRHASLAALTRDALGESVPVEALFDWLRGRPWPGAASAPAEGGFAQLGWRVDTSGLGAGRLVARRAAPEPAVDVRIRLDPAGG